MDSLNYRGIYPDLLRQFIAEGNHVFVISPFQRRTRKKECVIQDGLVKILKVKIGNTTKTNLLEKGISTLTLEHKVKSAVAKYFADVKFDLVLYPTPPITLCKTVSYIKKRDGAKTYLMLKDIFPQNAVDLGMLQKRGIQGLIYRLFRAKERRLYALSDHIGCMTPANVRYVLAHNADIEKSRVGLCPNAIELHDVSLSEQARRQMRTRYQLPQDKKIFVYGGNIGKPQGVEYLIACIEAMQAREDIFFLVVGSGTEYYKLTQYAQRTKAANLRLLPELPAAEFDELLACCDVGLLFLDARFTIPNFPSRILSYMQAQLPILAATDNATDLGDILRENACGVQCLSREVAAFTAAADALLAQDLRRMGSNGYALLKREYTAHDAYKHIMTAIGKAGSV
ncbi:MAG: glycosyltransferase family 4 protein [Oscillospiraceae bacterium]|nr:glycosyltransferase family 4 protein [Oscillospiraceae bacterium]